jgi:hypothetical protein
VLLACVAEHPTEDIGRASFGPVLAQVSFRHAHPLLASNAIGPQDSLRTSLSQRAVDACFAPDFAFHGPDGAEMDHDGLKRCFASFASSVR